MLTLLSISFIFVLGLWFARYLTECLANRPERDPMHSQEEILDEIDRAFVDRDVLSFAINLDSVPVLLHRLTESVGLGFGAKQADALAYRVCHQHANEFYHATYPVEVSGVPSDLEFQWCREDDRTVRIAVCAVSEVVNYATDAVGDLAIEHRA